MSKKVTVVGLGYVGLPLAVQCKKKGFDVKGYDTDKLRVKIINEGRSPIKDLSNLLDLETTYNPSIIQESDIVLVCTPTPVNSKYIPNLKPLISAIETIIDNHKPGQLIIVESTINPGVMEEVVKPEFDRSNLFIGKDYFLAHCPERIDPGNKDYDVGNIPRVLGAFTKEGLGKAYNFYNKLIDAEIMKMDSIKVVEATKIVENTFRDVNIAFVNELAKSFDKMGVDITEVIKGASTKPFGFMAHYPGCGVGGHCIPVDPYYLIEKGKEEGFDHKFLKLAREINNSMPYYTTELVVDGLNKLKKSINGSTIGILGVSYKKNVGDTRGSPSLDIISQLKSKGAQLKIYDPFVPEKSNASKKEVLNSDCVVLVTDHDEFKTYDFSKTNLVIDGRNFLDKEELEKQGLLYKGIGK